MSQLIKDIKLKTYDQLKKTNYEICLPGKAHDYIKDEDVSKECDFNNLRFYYLKDYISNNSRDLLERFQEFQKLKKKNPDLEDFDLEEKFQENIINDFKIINENYPGYLPFNLDAIDVLNNEFIDFLFEFPTCVMEEGTLINHSSKIQGLFDFNMSNKDLLLNEGNCFWNERYIVGQELYKGGWYTINADNYGGPKFGLDLIFEFKKTVSILFIPPIYKKLFYNKDKRYYDSLYFSEDIKDKESINNQIENLMDKIDNLENNIKDEDMKLFEFLKQRYPSQSEIKNIIETIKIIEYEDIETLKNYIKQNFKEKILVIEELNRTKAEIKSLENLETIIQYIENGFSGSHIIEGVKDWQEKNYPKVTRKEGEYADNLAIKLSFLGFYGYISCDECEVYISHNLLENQSNILEGPVKINLDTTKFYDQILNKRLKDEDKQKIYNQALDNLLKICPVEAGIFLNKIKGGHRDQKSSQKWITIYKLDEKVSK